MESCLINVKDCLWLHQEKFFLCYNFIPKIIEILFDIFGYHSQVSIINKYRGVSTI